MSTLRTLPIRVPLRGRIGEPPPTRSVLKVIAIVLGVAALLWLVYVSRTVLAWLAVGAFLAVAINPLVGAIQKRLRMPRSVSILLVYLVVLAMLGGLALLFVPPLIEAGQGLSDTLPGYVEQVRDSSLVERLDREYDLSRRVEEELTSGLSGVAGPSTAVALAQRLISGLVAVISIAVITVLLSLYGPNLRAWTLDQARGTARERVDRVLGRIYRVIAGYVVGVLLVAVLGALAVYAFLTILGIPFAPVLSLWVGLMSLIPLVGATLGALPYIAVAFFQGWEYGVAAIAFVLIYQQLENHLVQPVVHRQTVHLNPLWIILAVLIGAQVLGVVGVLVAIPVAGIVQVLLAEWWTERRRRREERASGAESELIVVIE